MFSADRSALTHQPEGNLTPPLPCPGTPCHPRPGPLNVWFRVAEGTRSGSHVPSRPSPGPRPSRKHARVSRRLAVLPWPSPSLGCHWAP